MNIIPEIQALQGEMTQWRRHIHAHPETAFEEVETSAYVAGLLNTWGIETHRGMAKTAVVGVIEGKRGRGNRAIALRADMDALNMQEETGLPYASCHSGKMHGCGHDGHTTMLLGAAHHLARHRDFAGTVYLVFQPAEEGDGGGRVMVEEGFFEKFPCEAIYGMHNWPGLPLGKVGVRVGPMTASADDIQITVHGRGGHAAMPHLAIDTVLVASHIVTALQSIASRRTSPIDSAVVSICKFHAGSSSNVIPESAVLQGTLRTFLPETRRMAMEEIRRIATSVAESFGARADVIIETGYPSVINTREEALLAARAAARVVGNDNVDTEHPPTMGAEDFAFFLQEKPGCYIFLGQGTDRKAASLHSAKYDFNDDALPVGASYWVRLVEEAFRQAA